MDCRTLRELVRDLLCSAYFETRFERGDPRTISVTEVTQCLRYSWFARREPKCIPQVVTLLLGVEGHKLFLSKLQSYGFITEKLVAERRDGVKLVGRCDAWHPDLDVVVEFKTCRKVPPEPYDDHVFQARIYAELLRARNIFIVYVAREMPYDVKVFSVSPKHVLDKAFERAKILSRCLEKAEIPPRDRGRWCRYCPYSFECAKYGDGRRS